MAYGKRLNIYIGNRNPKIMLSCHVFPVNLSFLSANTVFCSSNKYLLYFLYEMVWCNLQNFNINPKRQIQEFFYSSQKHIHRETYPHCNSVVYLHIYTLVLAGSVVMLKIVLPVNITSKKSNVWECCFICPCKFLLMNWLWTLQKHSEIRWDNCLEWHLGDQIFWVWKLLHRLLITWSLWKFETMLQSLHRVLCCVFSSLVMFS